MARIPTDAVSSSPTPEYQHEYAVESADALESGTEIRALWHMGLEAGYSLEQKFDWYYQRNPAGLPSAYFLRHGKAEKAVGVASAGSRDMRLNGIMLSTGVAVDFVVDPGHRTLFLRYTCKERF
ncbi:MAG: hypothetical protein IPP88_22665 [Betaproteobacteria bacterium]|nr:hypothetical protein [Betaproteobacteria bacterium]